MARTWTHTVVSLPKERRRRGSRAGSALAWLPWSTPSSCLVDPSWSVFQKSWVLAPRALSAPSLLRSWARLGHVPRQGASSCPPPSLGHVRFQLGCWEGIVADLCDEAGWPATLKHASSHKSAPAAPLITFAETFSDCVFLCAHYSCSRAGFRWGAVMGFKCAGAVRNFDAWLHSVRRGPCREGNAMGWSTAIFIHWRERVHKAAQLCSETLKARNTRFSVFQ